MGKGCYITLFSPSDVTAFHIIANNVIVFKIIILLILRLKYMSVLCNVTLQDIDSKVNYFIKIIYI